MVNEHILLCDPNYIYVEAVQMSPTDGSVSIVTGLWAGSLGLNSW